MSVDSLSAIKHLQRTVEYHWHDVVITQSIPVVDKASVFRLFKLVVYLTCGVDDVSNIEVIESLTIP